MSTKPDIYNSWCIYIGADFRENLRATDSSLDQIDNPDYDSDRPPSISNPLKIPAGKDLTGYDAKMDILDAPGQLSGSVLASLTVGSGITIGSPSATDGTIELFIDNTVTDAAPFPAQAGNDAYYTLFLKEPGNNDWQPWLEGTIAIVDPNTDLTGL